MASSAQMDQEREIYPETAAEIRLMNKVDRFSNMYRYSLDDMSGAERQLLFFISLRELKNEYWTTSARKEMAQAMDEVLKSHPEIQITEAVCFGLGHLTKYKDWDNYGNGDGDDEDLGTNYDKAALGQLAAFACWVDIISEWNRYVLMFTYLTNISLESKFNIEKVYLHDPRFRIEVEIRLLKKLGFVAGSNSSRRPPISDNTFLFSAHCAPEQLFPCFTSAQPALYIGNDRHMEPSCPHGSSPEDFRRTVYELQQAPVRSFFETRASFEIPEIKLLEPERFAMGITAGKPEDRWPVNCMKVYWKANKDDEIDKEVAKFYEDNKEPIELSSLKEPPQKQKGAMAGKADMDLDSSGWDSDFDLAKILTEQILKERKKSTTKGVGQKKKGSPAKQKVGQTKKDGNIARFFEAASPAAKNKKGSSSK